MTVECNYCGKESKLVTGDKIYPHRTDLSAKYFYLCKPCDAYVGCHPGTKKELGRLADKNLRFWKGKAHAVFDPIWQSKQMTRHEAYQWMSKQLMIPPSQCHIGMFDVDICKQLVDCVERWVEFYE